MEPAPIPDRMTAVVLDSYSGPEGLRAEQRDVPQPARNQVLIRIAASPINPSDLAFLHGAYAFRPPPPVVPGLEASGTVVAAGPGMRGRRLLGRRVACLRRGPQRGVWAEYVVTAARGGALPLHRSVDLEQGAMSVVNPLTALCLLEVLEKGRHRAVVQTAAASALGQMLDRLARRAGIRVVNVVRRPAQVELLRHRGAAIVLDSSDPGFDRELAEACGRHGARLAFDAVAGPMTSRLLAALPPRSKVTVYGGLSGERAAATPEQLVFEEKSVDGFWLAPELGRRGPIRLLRLWRRAQGLLGAELRTEVRARYPFAEARQAVEAYQGQMTGGKILLGPGHDDPGRRAVQKA